MAEEDSMDAATDKANQLNEQAAALRAGWLSFAPIAALVSTPTAWYRVTTTRRGAVSMSAQVQFQKYAESRTAVQAVAICCNISPQILHQ